MFMGNAVRENTSTTETIMYLTVAVVTAVNTNYSNRMVIAEVEEVFLKYKAKEEKIEILLRHKDASNHGLSPTPLEIRPLQVTMEEAKNRNKQILKELEFVKGNLRSKAIFSPTELQWEKLWDQYQTNPSLTVRTWHCHLPVFV